MTGPAWQAAYKGHNVWVALDQLSTHLHERNPAPEERQDVDRILPVINHLEILRSNPSPLVSTVALNQLLHPLNSLDSLVSQWSNGGGGHQLAQAVQTCLDPVLEAIRGFPSVSKDKFVKGTIASAEAFQASAYEEIEGLRGQIAQLGRKMVDMDEASVQMRLRNEQEIQSLRERILAEDSRLAGQRERLDNALNGLQQTFAQAEAERARTHQLAVSEQRQAVVEVAEAVREQAATVLKTHVELGDEYLEQLSKADEDAKKLVSAIGLTGTATEYGAYAEQQRKVANRLRISAVSGLLAAFAMFTYTIFYSHAVAMMSWQFVVLRLGGSIALLAAGAYLARESAHHRTEEKLAKSKQLDLVAINPFIITLSENEQRAIRGAAARRLFTNVDSAASPTEAMVPDSAKLVEILVATLGDLTRSSRAANDSR